MLAKPPRRAGLTGYAARALRRPVGQPVAWPPHRSVSHGLAHSSRRP